MRSSGIGYYQPLTGGDATANALGAFGKTMSDLGQLSLDDKKVKNEEAWQNEKLILARNADKRGDEELKLKADEVYGKNKYYDDKSKAERQKQLDEQLKAKNMAGAFRVLHPEATKNLSDEQVMAWGEHMDKLLPKDRKIDKIDARITPDGDKIITYLDNNQIVERNMGKVKTDWNVGKDTPSSEIPSGHIAVDESYFKMQADKLPMKKTKDGRAYSSIDDFNGWIKNRDDGIKKEFKLPLPEDDSDE